MAIAAIAPSRLGLTPGTTTYPTSTTPQPSGSTSILQEAGTIINSAKNAIAAVNNLFGSGGRFNNKDYQAAVRALGDACVTGVAAGQVQAAQYLYGYLRPTLSDYASTYFDNLISLCEQKYPSLMQQGKQNPVSPGNDGFAILQLLLVNRIPFSEPFMGYDTADIPSSGEPPAPTAATAAVVAQLQQLKASSPAALGVTAQAGTGLLLGGGLLLAFFIYKSRAL